MLPDKPEQVKDVSDRLWEAALRMAWGKVRGDTGFLCDFGYVDWQGHGSSYAIDHARCLIMLGEVEEPRDPLDEAIEAAADTFQALFNSGENPTLRDDFIQAVRQHLGPFLKGEG